MSALHGRGIGDLEAAIVDALPPPQEETEDPTRLPRITIAGKPNAGKSQNRKPWVKSYTAKTHNGPGQRKKGWAAA